MNPITPTQPEVSNTYLLRQQRLLIDSLYGSYTPPDGQPFLATANVWIYYAVTRPPFIPDFFLCLNTDAPELDGSKEHRSFFFWVHGTLPELVLEIVSDTDGGEEDSKRRAYAERRIPLYVIFDPAGYLSKEPLRVFELQRTKYLQVDSRLLPEIELGLTLEPGTFEGMTTTWLRWCDASGNILLTDTERADQENLQDDEVAPHIVRIEPTE